MKTFNLKLIIASLFSYCNAVVINESSSFELSELINGTKYDLVETVRNSKRVENYYINGKKVSDKEFIDSKVVSRVKELEAQAYKEQDKRKKEFEFKNEVRLKTLEKLICVKLKELKDQVAKLERLNISNFYIYSNDTFMNEEDYNNLKETLEDIDLMIDSNHTLLYEDFESIFNKLENREKKLELFYKSSIENAINKCDDTKLLKELLLVV